MLTVIKNAELYAPEYIGKKTIVIANDKIEGIYEKIDIPKNFLDIEVIDGENMIAVPGFIDCHVHVMGGGGEGGFKTRTPEIYFSEFVKAGITTVVGCIGTDGVCRNMQSLIAKCYALEEEGITTYCYTGSYEIPVKTVTGSIKSDIMLLHKVIGAGEICLSDNRSSQPSYEEFLKVVADSRVGGLLAGKAGIVNVHLGNEGNMMDYLFSIIDNTGIPSAQLLPTHINRNQGLFNTGIKYAKRGGYVDLTTASDPDYLEDGEVKASEGLKVMLKEGVSEDRITFSSDGNGSMPRFNEKKEIVGLGICSLTSLYREFKDCVIKEGIPFEKALKVITSNVSDILKLGNKGRLAEGKDADILILEKGTLNISTIFAKGRKLKENGEILVKGTYEGEGGNVDKYKN